MRIEQLLENHMNSGKRLLKESCDGLTQEQRIIVEGIYNEFVPLIEATLTADQIKNIFKGVEQAAIAGGDNRTLAGLGVDGAKKVNDTINSIGKWLQDTTPVKAFDAKFEQLKDKVAQKFPGLADQAAGLGEWVKANPGKSAAVIGVLTALASLAGGPVGGAIAGQILKGSVELLKGEKLSTAIGKGIKTAALGYLSGKAFEMLGNWVGGFREQAIPFGPKDAGLEKVNWGATRTLTAPGMSSTETIQGFNITVFPEQREAVQQAMNAIRDGQAGGFDTLKTIAREINTPEYKSAIGDIMKGARQVQLDNDSLLQWINGVSKAGQAISQGAVAGASAMPAKKESVYLQTRPLSEGQVYLLFKRISQQQTVMEAGFMDKAKELGSKAVGAVGKGLQRVGQNITNKVTYEKLLAGWKLDGSPTDSEALKKFLNSMEVSDKIINQVYADMKIDNGQQASATAQSTYMQVKDQITKLDKKGRQRLAAYLQKQLGTA
jgi:hypothetical protein